MTLPKLHFNRTTILVILAAVVAAISFGGYSYYNYQTRPDEVKAEEFITGFKATADAEERLYNLVGLFKLPRYQNQARKLFFEELKGYGRLNIFQGLSNPQQVGPNILTVVVGTYQDPRLENNSEHNQLLRTMSVILSEVGDTVPGAQVKAEEIEHWLEGRDHMAQRDFSQAVEDYKGALDLNKTNPSILVDRAQAYAALGEYELAVSDLKSALELDQGQKDKIMITIEANPGLFTYIGLHRDETEPIASWFPTLTPTPTSTPSPTPTPSPTNTPTTPPSPTPLTPTATPSSTSTPIPQTPTPTPLPPSPTPTDTPVPIISGKLAVPIDDGAGHYDVWIYQLPSGKLSSKISRVHQPNLSPDGTRLLVHNQEQGHIWQFNVDGSGARRISEYAGDQHPFYNPDSNSFAFDNGELQAENQWQTLVRHGLSPNDKFFSLKVGLWDMFNYGTPMFPLWASDHTIVFRGCDTWQPAGGQTCGIWRKGQDRTSPSPLIGDTTAIPTDTQDTRLVYMSRTPGNWDIFLTSINGGQAINLTQDPAEDGLGTLSPDGRSVAFVSNRGGRWGVWIVPIDGGPAQELSFIEIPGWSGEWTNERISWGP